MLNAIMLSVANKPIMKSVVMLNIFAPFKCFYKVEVTFCEGTNLQRMFIDKISQLFSDSSAREVLLKGKALCG
jgi:uncharacterized protein (DUF486 family)